MDNILAYADCFCSDFRQEKKLQNLNKGVIFRSPLQYGNLCPINLRKLGGQYFSNHPVRKDEGSIANFVVVFCDITDILSPYRCTLTRTVLAWFFPREKSRPTTFCYNSTGVVQSVHSGLKKVVRGYIKNSLIKKILQCCMCLKSVNVIATK